MNIRKTPNFIKLGLGFILIALLSPKMAQGAPLVSTACARALDAAAVSARLEEGRDDIPTVNQTVGYLGHNDKNQVVFEKTDKKSIWSSYHSFYETSPQGDLRWFINFAGLELARNLGFEMSETEINNIFQSNTRHTSLDAPVHEAEDVAMGDLLEGSDDTDEDVMKDSLREEIRRVLKSLSPREAES